MKKALQPNHVLCNSCCSVTKSFPTLCDPMDCSTPDSLCPPLSPGVYSDSCSSCQWCYLSISSSAALFFSCPQSFPESGSFQMNRHFASGGKSFGASASASVLPMNIQGWFPLGLTDLISLLELSKCLLQHHSLKASSVWCSGNTNYLSSRNSPGGCLGLTAKNVMDQKFKKKLLSVYEICTYIRHLNLQSCFILNITTA